MPRKLSSRVAVERRGSLSNLAGHASTIVAACKSALKVNSVAPVEQPSSGDKQVGKRLAPKRQSSGLHVDVNSDASDEGYGDLPLHSIEMQDEPEPASPAQSVRISTLVSASESFHSKSRWTVGMDGKEYHFFLSHKKWHSRDGAVHHQIAASLVDALGLLNFTGFFDVDSLEEISAPAIREGVEKSCAMVVLLHDETHESDWCQLEWTLAEEMGLPVCVVIDMERASKADELARAKAYPGSLRFQWIEYTSMRRREALDDVTQFLTKHTMRRGREDDENSDLMSELRERGTLWYGKINFLMLWGGLNTLQEKYLSQGQAIWFRLVRFSTVLCVFTCLSRLVYAHGPAFVDHSSTLATLLLHFHLLYAPHRLRVVFNSSNIKKIRKEVLRAADLSDIYWISKMLYFVGAPLIPILLLVYVVSWEPLFFSELYIGADRTELEKAFGYASGSLFLFGILTHIPMLVCVHIMSALIKMLSLVACESAADALHPQIAAIGLRRYVDSRRRVTRFRSSQGDTLQVHEQEQLNLKDMTSQTTSTIVLTEESTVIFQEHWQLGWQIYQELNHSLMPMQDVQLVWGFTSLAVPFCLAIQSLNDDTFMVDRFQSGPRYIFWLNSVRVIWIWLQGPLLILIELGAEAAATVRMRQTVDYIDRIVYTKPSNHSIINEIAKLKQPSRFSSLRIPASPLTLLCMLLLYVASAVPWFFVRFTSDI